MRFSCAIVAIVGVLAKHKKYEKVESKLLKNIKRNLLVCNVLYTYVLRLFKESYLF